MINKYYKNKSNKLVIKAFNNELDARSFSDKDLDEITNDEFKGYQLNSSIDFSEQAKLTLSNALTEDIESGGYTWQVRNQIDLQNIQDAIDQHEYDGLSDDETQSFRMSDNVWHDVTVADFKKVLSDYRVRKKDIYASFRTWTETDMSESFSI